MKPAAICAEIETLREQVAERQRKQEQHTQDVARALTATPESYSDAEVSYAKAVLADDDRWLASRAERIAALEGLLPPDGAVRRAQAEAQALLREVEAASSEFEQEGARFFAALGEVERAGHVLASMHAAAVVKRNQLADLVSDFGLNLDVPQTPAPSPSNAKIGYLAGLFLSEVAACGEASDIVMRDLAAERRRQESSN